VRRSHKMRALQLGLGRWALLSCIVLLSHSVTAQTGQKGPHGPKAEAPAQGTVPVVLLSDIHFEPFRDPGKVQELVAAPASKWKAILAAPPSPDKEQRFAALQLGCHTRGPDTSYALLESSLLAMQSLASELTFVTVSGDLISHAFSCKYTTLFPHSTPGEYKAFVAKTLEYVMGRLLSSFPGTLIYAALGNNDTDLW
jgi:sphingomyelin phosphodiesterase acid-like 3